MLRIVAFLLATLASAQTLQVTSKLGTKFYSLADEKAGIPAAEKALAANPKDTALLMKLVQAQFSVWQDREAVATCNRVLQLDPNHIDALIERGHRELPLRDFSPAATDLARAAKLDATKTEAWYHLGLAYYFQAEFAQAAEAFAHAVDRAANTDSRINSTNWLYASLRRANQSEAAAKALAAITPEMKNTEPHTLHYLNLVRFFQGRMAESDALPPEPPAGSTDTEAELAFDTVAYGIGNWHLYNGHPDQARKYFERVLKGRVWITWGFVGSEAEILRMKK